MAPKSTSCQLEVFLGYDHSGSGQHDGNFDCNCRTLLVVCSVLALRTAKSRGKRIIRKIPKRLRENILGRRTDY